VDLRLLGIEYQNKPSLLTRVYNNPKTCVVVIDMVNGFCNSGALASPRCASVAGGIASALDYLNDAYKVFICDEHSSNAVEFNSFPPHCHNKTESAVIKELAPYADFIIGKNSTNGIFKFLSSVAIVNSFDNFLIMGVCTDICVLQFALSLKAYLNESDKPANVIVFTDYTETYDMDGHNADSFNAAAYKLMENAGISIFKNLK